MPGYGVATGTVGVEVQGCAVIDWRVATMHQTDRHLFAVSGCGRESLGLILRGIVTARDALHFAGPQAAAG
ncbi:MAG: hypothetical protein CM15mP120_16800 [Pseudomonadota bacterium]|nr:MAG: hypothetical protein CM15mP120_16800 [Pseudomonadota bacterium]